jgi:hypothetical protein
MAASHSSQWVSPGPWRNCWRARSTASLTVASIWSCTAPSPAHPVAMLFEASFATLSANLFQAEQAGFQADGSDGTTRKRLFARRMRVCHRNDSLHRASTFNWTSKSAKTPV